MITEHPQPAASLTDASLRALVVDLAPLARLDAVAGLRARSRDPREQPGTGGEQRDAVAAWLGIDDGDALADCARWHGLGLRTRWLWAPWAVVRERLAARGEDPSHAEAEQTRWHELVSTAGDGGAREYLTGGVATDQPAAEVTAFLVEWSERVIRAAAVERAR